MEWDGRKCEGEGQNHSAAWRQVGILERAGRVGAATYRARARAWGDRAVDGSGGVE